MDVEADDAECLVLLADGLKALAAGDLTAADGYILRALVLAEDAQVRPAIAAMRGRFEQGDSQ